MDITLEKVEESKKDVLYRLLQYSLFEESLSDQKAAFACFERYPGNWEVFPSYGSEQAYLFWKHVIHEYAGKNDQYEDGIFLFSNCALTRER